MDDPPEADLDLIAQDQRDDVLRVACAHRDLDPGMSGDKPLEQAGQQVGADSGCARDHQMPSRRRHRLLEGVATVDKSAEGALGKGHPGAAGLGEPHSSWSALKELGPQLAFETVEAGGQRWLRDEERFGGAAHAAEPGHLEKALDLHELNRVEPPAVGLIHRSNLYLSGARE